MAELFTEDEVFTDTAMCVSRLYEDAMDKVTDEVLERYGNIPLRQLEYIATMSVFMIFSERLLEHMHRKAKEQRREEVEDV